MTSFAASIVTVPAAVVLGLIPAVFGHGDEKMDEDMGVDNMDQPGPEASTLPTYFALSEHRDLIWGHITLMVFAWVFLLPAAVMLSLARSRYTITSQVIFAGTNALGLLLGTIYSTHTPDLYPNNTHRGLGWFATLMVFAQIAIGLSSRIASILKRNFHHPRQLAEDQGLIPDSIDSHEEIEENRSSRFGSFSRLYQDHGQDVVPSAERVRSDSMSSVPMLPTTGDQGNDDEMEHSDNEYDSHEIRLPTSILHRTGHAFGSYSIQRSLSQTWKLTLFFYHFIDRTILVLGFITICTGIVVFGRFFEGKRVFNGLAHWIKGGVFFWLGILTLGRWSGCFGDLGWAWNIRPTTTKQKWRPSAEFVESALIFFYGSTNIFLEHLGAWGGEWSAQDLEHLAITVLFLGGGLCGMLIESTRIRKLLNTSVNETARTYSDLTSQDEKLDQLAPPRQYSFSMNPFPALIILLLGIMMSSHTQHTMMSSMIHKQWGNLLAGASCARFLTYIIMYLSPPKSILPSRPPTELLASFGLISGGIIFMASSSDIVDGIIHHHLDAMFIYTVTMGLVGIFMSWVIILIALKGWATCKEARFTESYQMA